MVTINKLTTFIENSELAPEEQVKLEELFDAIDLDEQVGNADSDISSQEWQVLKNSDEFQEILDKTFRHGDETSRSAFTSRLNALFRPAVSSAPKTAVSSATDIPIEASRPSEVAQGIAAKTSPLLAQLLEPLYVAADGSMNEALIPAKSYLDFQEFLLAQAEVDQKSFRSPYLSLIDSQEWLPLFEAVYLSLPQASANSDYSELVSKVNKYSPGVFSQALTHLTTEMIAVDGALFVSHNFFSKEGRARLKSILDKPQVYGADAVHALVVGIKSVARDHLGDEMVGGIQSQISYLENYSTAFVSEEELSHAIDSANVTLIGMDTIQSHQAGEARSKRVESDATTLPKEFDRDHKDVTTSDGLKTRFINQAEVTEMLALQKELENAVPGPVTQLRQTLVNLWLMAADDTPWSEHLELSGAEIVTVRNYILQNAGLMEITLRKISSDDGFGGLKDFVTHTLVPFIEAPIESGGMNNLADAFWGADLESALEDLPAVYQEPFTQLKTLADELYYSFDMGESILRNTEIAANLGAKPAYAGQQEIVELITQLDKAKRSLCVGYKQHGALSRGLSQMADGMGMEGDISQINDASSFIDVLVYSLSTTTADNLNSTLAAVVDELFEAMKEDGVLMIAIRDAAANEGLEQCLSTLQFVIEGIILGMATGGVAWAAKAAQVGLVIRGVRLTRGLATAAEVAETGATVAKVAETGAAAAEVAETGAAVSRGIKVAQAFGSGSGIVTINNAVELTTGGYRPKSETIESWFKDAVATGIASVLVGLPVLPASEIPSIAARLMRRYVPDAFKSGIRPALKESLHNLVEDAAIEIIEEVIDTYVRQCLDGNYSALSAEAFTDLALGSLSGGFTKVGVIREMIRPVAGKKSGSEISGQSEGETTPQNVDADPDPTMPASEIDPGVLAEETTDDNVSTPADTTATDPSIRAGDEEVQAGKSGDTPDDLISTTKADLPDKIADLNVAQAQALLGLSGSEDIGSIISAYLERCNELLLTERLQNPAEDQTRLSENMKTEMALFNAILTLIPVENLQPYLSLSDPFGRMYFVYQHSPFSRTCERPVIEGYPYYRGSENSRDLFLGREYQCNQQLLDLLWRANNPDLYAAENLKERARQNRQHIIDIIKFILPTGRDVTGYLRILGLNSISTETKEILSAAKAKKIPDDIAFGTEDWSPEAGSGSEADESKFQQYEDKLQSHRNFRETHDTLDNLKRLITDPKILSGIILNYLNICKSGFPLPVDAIVGRLLQRGVAESEMIEFLEIFSNADRNSLRRFITVFWAIGKVDDANLHNVWEAVCTEARTTGLSDPYRWQSLKQYLDSSVRVPQPDWTLTSQSMHLKHSASKDAIQNINEHGFAVTRFGQTGFYYPASYTGSQDVRTGAKTAAGGSGIYFGDDSFDWGTKFDASTSDSLEINLPTTGLRVYDYRNPQDRAYFEYWLYMSDYSPEENNNYTLTESVNALNVRTNISDAFAAENNLDAIYRADNDQGFDYTEFVVKSSHGFDVVNDLARLRTVNDRLEHFDDIDVDMAGDDGGGIPDDGDADLAAPSDEDYSPRDVGRRTTSFDGLDIDADAPSHSRRTTIEDAGCAAVGILPTGEVPADVISRAVSSRLIDANPQVATVLAKKGYTQGSPETNTLMLVLDQMVSAGEVDAENLSAAAAVIPVAAEMNTLVARYGSPEAVAKEAGKRSRVYVAMLHEEAERGTESNQVQHNARILSPSIFETPGQARVMNMDDAKLIIARQKALSASGVDPETLEVIDATRRSSMIADQNVPGVSANYKGLGGTFEENYLNADEGIPTADHHGDHAKHPDGTIDARNSTMKLLDLIEYVLKKEGGDINAAIATLNLNSVTTDNLADGAWCVWIAKNQSHVMSDPKLRALIREATTFEDFTAFGSTYYDANRGSPGIELQAALFNEYNKILAVHGIRGSDRFTPGQAQSVLDEACGAIDRMLYPASDRKKERREAAENFWTELDQAKAVAAEKGLMSNASVEGKVNFYDTKAMAEFGTLTQWLAIPLSHSENLQVSVAPMPPLAVGENSVPRSLMIVAIPDGRELPTGKGLLSIKDNLNAAEAAKAKQISEQYGINPPLQPNIWFGKDNVLLANPAGGGTLLTPTELSKILTNPELELFELLPDLSDNLEPEPDAPNIERSGRAAVDALDADDIDLSLYADEDDADRTDPQIRDPHVSAEFPQLFHDTALEDALPDLELDPILDLASSEVTESAPLSQAERHAAEMSSYLSGIQEIQSLSELTQSFGHCVALRDNPASTLSLQGPAGPLDPVDFHQAVAAYRAKLSELRETLPQTDYNSRLADVEQFGSFDVQGPADGQLSASDAAQLQSAERSWLEGREAQMLDAMERELDAFAAQIPVEDKKSAAKPVASSQSVTQEDLDSLVSAVDGKLTKYAELNAFYSEPEIVAARKMIEAHRGIIERLEAAGIDTTEVKAKLQTLIEEFNRLEQAYRDAHAQEEIAPAHPNDEGTAPRPDTPAFWGENTAPLPQSTQPQIVPRRVQQGSRSSDGIAETTSNSPQNEPSVHTERIPVSDLADVTQDVRRVTSDAAGDTELMAAKRATLVKDEFESPVDALVSEMRTLIQSLPLDSTRPDLEARYDAIGEEIGDFHAQLDMIEDRAEFYGPEVSAQTAGLRLHLRQSYVELALRYEQAEVQGAIDLDIKQMKQELFTRLREKRPLSEVEYELYRAKVGPRIGDPRDDSLYRRIDTLHQDYQNELERFGMLRNSDNFNGLEPGYFVVPEREGVSEILDLIERLNDFS